MRADDPQFLSLIDIACQAAREAGSKLKRRDLGIVSESEHDIKSEGDLVANQLILDWLGSTGIPIVTEEKSTSWQYIDASGLRWIVDPLDGTVNYTKGSPLCCVSIGLWEGMDPLYGVIFDFERDELVEGGPGLGAKCNGECIQVSDARSTKAGVLGTGFPSGRSYNSRQLEIFAETVGRYRKVRLLGSAAMSLAWIARGWLDAYHEDGIYLWDVAAGLAIVLGAGGVVRCQVSAESVAKAEVFAAGTEMLLADM